jgi:Family of unknown function (DUF5681)
MSDTGNDDAGGYKRPPPRSRFKTGQSGNPKGRPKGGRNLKTDLTALLKQRVAIREDGELRQVSRQEAMLLSLFEKAVHGDIKASSQMFAMLMKMDIRDPAPQEPAVVTDNDRAIVEDFLRRNLATNLEGDES